MKKKEFGRYSRNDLRAFSQLIASLERDFTDVKELMSSEPDRLAEVLSRPFYWANLYQIPFLDLMFRAATFMGLSSHLAAFAKETDPLATAIREIPKLEPGLEVDPDKITYLMGMLMALQGHLRSVSFYSKSMEELTKEVGAGSEKAFFEAVLIDRTILACPAFADRMAWAEYQGDETFFQTLAKRLQQGKPSKKMKAYVPLRVCLYALEQENCLATLTEMRAYELFCHELKLFPDDLYGKAPRNLKRFIQRWQAERAT